MKTRDLRVTGYRPLVPPAIILEELPLSETGSRLVAKWREDLTRILSLADDRLIAIVGPCSIHDPVAALDRHGLRAEVGHDDLDLAAVVAVDRAGSVEQAEAVPEGECPIAPRVADGGVEDAPGERDTGGPGAARRGSGQGGGQ